ncbi:hypothetical protein C1N55_02420 [Lysinibacillus sp. SGAir0095]|nr:hypothetical protein C1N55_02420 [Lysinibacillus sp. SGAir0095]
MDKNIFLNSFFTVFFISITYRIMSSLSLTNKWILNQVINVLVSLLVFFILTRIWSYFKKKNKKRKNFKRIKSTKGRYSK